MKCYEACFPPYSPHPGPTQQFHILPPEFSFLKHACSAARSCPTLWDPMDYSPPGSSVQVILQARIMEWAAISISRGSSQPRDRTRFSGISCNGRWIFFFFSFTTGKLLKPRAFLFFSRESFGACKYSSHDPDV